jgi:fatty acid desaturase
VTGTLVFVFWAQANWLAFAAAMFVHGTIGSFFIGTAPHELGHGTVFRSKALNRILLYIFSLLSWWNPFDCARNDIYHQRDTLHPDGDREFFAVASQHRQALHFVNTHHQPSHAARADLWKRWVAVDGLGESVSCL